MVRARSPFVRSLFLPFVAISGAIGFYVHASNIGATARERKRKDEKRVERKSHGVVKYGGVSRNG